MIGSGEYVEMVNHDAERALEAFVWRCTMWFYEPVSQDVYEHTACHAYRRKSGDGGDQHPSMHACRQGGYSWVGRTGLTA